MNYDLNDHTNLSFKALTTLFTERGVNLRRGGVTLEYPNCCVLSALAVINDVRYSGLVFSPILKLDTIKKLSSIEIGFEGWPIEDWERKDYYKKYVEIGKSLYKWSVAQS